MTEDVVDTDMVGTWLWLRECPRVGGRGAADVLEVSVERCSDMAVAAAAAAAVVAAEGVVITVARLAALLDGVAPPCRSDAAGLFAPAATPVPVLVRDPAGVVEVVGGLLDDAKPPAAGEGSMAVYADMQPVMQGIGPGARAGIRVRGGSTYCPLKRGASSIRS
jgi:hypothetical protein